jgi:DNA end-binding protein Ku
LIDAYTQPFEVSKFKDHYEEALRELVEAKIKNLPAPEPEVEKKPPKVVDLMEALRKSLAQAAPAAQEGTEQRAAGGKANGSGAKAKTGGVPARTAAARKTKSA